jgi:hypothetical protein
MKVAARTAAVVMTALMLSVLQPSFFMCSRKKSMCSLQ